MFYNLHTIWQFLLFSLGLAIFAIFCWRQPRRSALAIILAAPLYLIKIGVWPLTVLESLLWVYILVRLGVGARAKKKWRLSDSGCVLAVAIILLGVIWSLFLSPDPPAGLGILKSWFVAPLVFAWLLAGELKEDGPGDILRAVFASSLVVAGIGLVYLLFGRLTYDGRLAAFYLSPNHLAMFLAPGLLAGLALPPAGGRLSRKIGWLAGLGCLIVVIAATQSFGSWLGLVAALIFAGFWLWRSGLTGGKKTLVLFLWPAIIFFLAILAQLFGPSGGKLAEFLASPRSSWQSRLMVWQSAAVILKDHWFFGIGPGLFQKYYLAYQSYFSEPYLEWAVPQPHNVYLAWWLQAGLAGLVGFLGLVAIFFQRGFKFLAEIKSPPMIFVMAVMVYFLIHGLVDTTFWKNDLALIFWVIVFSGCRAGRRAYW